MVLLVIISTKYMTSYNMFNTLIGGMVWVDSTLWKISWKSYAQFYNMSVLIYDKERSKNDCSANIFLEVATSEKTKLPNDIIFQYAYNGHIRYVTLLLNSLSYLISSHRINFLRTVQTIHKYMQICTWSLTDFHPVLK